MALRGGVASLLTATSTAGHTAFVRIFPNTTTNIASTNGGARTTYFSGRLMP